jgi:hypothetical protein
LLVNILRMIFNSRDQYGNSWEQIYGSIATSLVQPDGISAIRPSLVLPARSPLWNRYVYMPAAIGIHTLIPSLVDGTGIWATYYAPGLTGAYLARTDSTIDFSSSSSNPGLWLGITSSFLSVRWNTYFRPPVNGSLSFQTSLLEQNCRVRLYFENSLVIDQWSSLASLLPSNEVGSLDASQFYSLRVEYTRFGAAPLFGLQLRSAVANSTFSPVASSSLFLGYQILGSPFKVRVLGGFACATTSNLFWATASFMTAGVTSTFCLTTRDSFGNPAAPLSPAKVFAYARFPDPPVLDTGKVVGIAQVQNRSEFQIDGGQANVTRRMYNALAGQLIEIGGESRQMKESSVNGIIQVASNFSVSPQVGAPYAIRALPSLPVMWANVTATGKNLKVLKTS